jgi:hypothetical protein
MGLSARALLDQSRDAKPEFESFWDRRRKKVEYPVRFGSFYMHTYVNLINRI